MIGRTNTACWDVIGYINELLNIINNLDADDKEVMMKQVAIRYKEINKKYDELRTLDLYGRDFDDFITELEELLEQTD